MEKEGQLATLERLIAESDLFGALLASEEFQEFWGALERAAAAQCVRVCKNRASHYEKAEASGIINFVERTRAEMVRKTTPDYREALKKRLEVVNGRGSERDRKGRRKLRGIEEAFGQF